jgi:hypothetical protein
MKCTDMTRILRLDEEGEVMDAPETKLSALELIEACIAQDSQAHLAQDLFDRLVAKGDMEHARKVAWHLFFNHGIDLSVA